MVEFPLFLILKGTMGWMVAKYGRDGMSKNNM
jgi:hypothetical protein